MSDIARRRSIEAAMDRLKKAHDIGNITTEGYMREMRGLKERRAALIGKAKN